MTDTAIKYHVGRDDDAEMDWQRVQSWLDGYGIDLGEYRNDLIGKARRPGGEGWLFRIEGAEDEGAVIIDAHIDYDAEVRGDSYVDCSHVVSVTIRREQ